MERISKSRMSRTLIAWRGLRWARRGLGRIDRREIVLKEIVLKEIVLREIVPQEIGPRVAGIVVEGLRDVEGVVLAGDRVAGAGLVVDVVLAAVVVAAEVGSRF